MLWFCPRLSLAPTAANSSVVIMRKVTHPAYLFLKQDRAISQKKKMRAVILLVAALVLATMGEAFITPAARFNAASSRVASSKKTVMMSSPDLWYPGMKWDSRGLRMSPDQEPEVDPRRKEEQKPERFPVRLPVIETQTGQIDVLSRLLKDRILLLGQQVDDEVANILVAQLLYLAQEDKEKDITLYINSPGGSVSAGLAIYDAMQFVPCDVATVCFGMAASMGAFLLGAGAKGKRRSLPNARIMIHQPLGGAQGQAADIEIQAKEILFVRSLLNSYISEYTGQPIDKIQEDCDRDFFMTPEEAVAYGMIDSIVPTKTSHLKKPTMPALLW